MFHRILPAIAALAALAAALPPAAAQRGTQHATRNTQHATRGARSSTINHQPSTRQWVWASGPGGTPDRIYLRQPFRLSEAPAEAKLDIEARGPYSVYVNGGLLVRGAAAVPQTLYLTRYVVKGPNLLAVEAQAQAAGAEPGVRFDLTVRYPNGRVAHVLSNGDERATRAAATGWETLAFDDRAWPTSMVVGAAANTQHATRNTPPPDTRNPTPAYDFGRLVRVWDLQAGARSGDDNPYTRARGAGDRMIMASGMPAARDLPLLASAGFTMVETSSDPLTTEESAPGVWDFARPDADRRAADQAGFAWSYFPHVAFPPKWYRDSIRFERIACLEHHQPVQAFSPWEPKYGITAAREYASLADHFKIENRKSKIENPSLYLGVHGEYGATGLLSGAGIQTPTLADIWKARFGNLHDHIGWWCDDPLARADFRDQVMRKYRDLDVLNSAWKTRFQSVDEVRYPTGPNDGARRYWLDFAHWYLSSATGIAETVAHAARQTFPDSLAMLPLGFANEDPRGGNDNSLAVKIASEQRVDVRSTHGGFRPFAQNQATEWGRIASAARFYGAPLWSEPPGATAPAQFPQRVFEAASQGAKGFYDRPENVRENRDQYYRLGKFLRVEKPIVDVAMFFPTTSHLLRPDEGYPPTFEKGCSDIRDVLNYDIVDERMVRDGALDRYRVLVLWEGTVVEADVLAKMRDWVQAGGTLVAYDFGKIETVEGDGSWFRDLFGYAGRLNAAAEVQTFVPEGRVPARYRVALTRPEAASFLSGDWLDRSVIRGEPHRWAGDVANLRLPIDPAASRTLLLRAALSPQSVRRRHEVLVNGLLVGTIEAQDDAIYRFDLPAFAPGSTGVAEVTIRTPGASPRSQEVAVAWAEIDAAGAPQAATDPGLPPGKMQLGLDLQRLRTEWARPYGRGWTVYYPAQRKQLTSYYEVVRYLTYHLSEIDPTKQDAIAVDDAWDGMYATLLSDKVLFYNPTARAITRTVALPAAAFAARRDVFTPTAPSYNVTVEPNGIASIYFDAPPQEMLFQCEGFRTLGALRPQTGGPYSPGGGPTHVLIPVGGQISTRIQVDVPGRYGVFYRAIRRGAQARAEVLLDGRPLAPPAPNTEHQTPNTASSTLPAGSADLARGVHTLTVRPLRGEDIRADFVVLTTDPDIAGYGFAVRPGR